MKKILISTLAVSALLFTVSCETDFEQDVTSIPVTAGQADFTRYVAIGNSLTSGYRDGALYITGQVESFPNMIATQMKLAGGGEFKQPLMADELGGMPSVGFLNKRILTPQMGVGVAEGTGTTTLQNIYAQGPYNNMGVPGAKSYHLVFQGYGNPANLAVGAANPYFVRFAKNPATSSVISDAMEMQPTFFSMWIGNNDVLSYATNGGMNSQTVNGVTTYTPAVVQTGNLNPATYKGNDISDPQVVGGAIKGMLDGLASVGSTKGVIANIPNVTTIPYFTRVRYNEIALDAATAQTLNSSLYQPLKAALTYLGAGERFNLVAAGQNPVVIVDNSMPNLSAQLTAVLTANGYPAPQAAMLGNAFGQARQAKPGELILLTASNELGKDALTGQAPTASSQFIVGASFPLHDRFSLTETEISNISTAVAAYNQAISGLATAYNLAFVDANKKMGELHSASGIQFDGVKYTTTFVTGGTFSLDGIHMTGRGYALIANEFIKAINSKYSSTLPQVNVNSYSGVTFP